MNESVRKSIKEAKQVGLKQYNDYVAEQIMTSQKPITDIIKKNSLQLFRSTQKPRTKSQLQTAVLKKDFNSFPDSTYLANQEMVIWNNSFHMKTKLNHLLSHHKES